ncbi:hypothetical protein [Clostridioides sp. ES-S-0001-03]|uniref:hypothetical protein n=1 Tax=Clostridioides sp. ES-S-0001-03 TaxID=2770771 RepID=UPI001D0C81E4|nr:hypothetical protein [Clostridioides sp. ES-S-0001-03]
MKISSQYRSQYLLNNESNIKNTKKNTNIIKKNETIEKNNYLSNIMKQKQELDNRIKDLKDKQELYAKKINEAIRNLFKSEEENKNTILEEYPISLNTGEKEESLNTDELNDKNEEKVEELDQKGVDNEKESEELEQKHIDKEDKELENLFLEGKTREELENMLKDFMSMAQEEIKKIESRIEKLDKDAEKYKKNQNINGQKNYIDTLI